MKTKRFWKKAIIIFIVIILVIAAVWGGAVLIYNNHLKQDDETLLESYETKQEKCELLKSIPNDFIEEGKGINLQEIPDNIRYEIKNQSDGNIQFYYYIEPETRSDSNTYKAWITLSKDYEVIEEDYGIELDNFETYKQKQEKMNLFLAYCLSIIIIWFAFFIIVLIAYITIRYINKKKSRS